MQQESPSAFTDALPERPAKLIGMQRKVVERFVRWLEQQGYSLSRGGKEVSPVEAMRHYAER